MDRGGSETDASVVAHYKMRLSHRFRQCLLKGDPENLHTLLRAVNNQIQLAIVKKGILLNRKPPVKGKSYTSFKLRTNTWTR